MTQDSDLATPMFDNACSTVWPTIVTDAPNEDSDEDAVFARREQQCKEDEDTQRIKNCPDVARKSNMTFDESTTDVYPYSGEPSLKDSEISLLTKTVDELHSKLLQTERDRCMYMDMALSMKGNVRAFCRLLPLPNSDSEDMCLTVISKTQLQVLPQNQRPTRSSENFKNNVRPTTPYTRSVWPQSNTKQTNSCPPRSFPRSCPKVFFFDHLFGQNATDKDVNDVVLEEMTMAWDGMGITVLAYGATGTGKTHTINAIAQSAALEFGRRAEIAKRSGEDVRLTVTILEVYNDQIRDLLGDPRQKLKITGSENPQVCGSRELVIDLEDVAGELQRAFSLGLANRKTSVTNVHQHSSRSHLLFTVNVDIKTQEDEKQGKLVLVDLAGSERLKESQAEGDRLIETQHINKSLSALHDVIWAYERKVPCVPFRNSKLTHLLQKSLGLPHSRTVVLVTCSPDAGHLKESMCSLKFGAKVNSITIPSNSAVSVSSVENCALKSQFEEERKQREKLEQEVSGLKFLLEKERQNPSSGNQMKTSEAAKKRSMAFSAAHVNTRMPIVNRISQSVTDRAFRPKSLERTTDAITERQAIENADLQGKLNAAKRQMAKLQRELAGKAKALSDANRDLDLLRSASISSRPMQNMKEWEPILTSRRSMDQDSEHRRFEHGDTQKKNSMPLRCKSGPMRFNYRPITRKPDGKVARNEEKSRGQSASADPTPLMLYFQRGVAFPAADAVSVVTAPSCAESIAPPSCCGSIATSPVSSPRARRAWQDDHSPAQSIICDTRADYTERESLGPESAVPILVPTSICSEICSGDISAEDSAIQSFGEKEDRRDDSQVREGSKQWECPPRQRNASREFVVEEISHMDARRIVGQEDFTRTHVSGRDEKKGSSPALLLRPLETQPKYDISCLQHSESQISLSSTGSEIKMRLGRMLPAQPRPTLQNRKSPRASHPEQISRNVRGPRPAGRTGRYSHVSPRVYGTAATSPRDERYHWH